MAKINYDELVSQLKMEINTECAIANRYGIVLASLIKEFAKGKVIPQKILELINSRDAIGDELNLKQIKSFALGAEEYNFLFTFSEELILISKLDLDVNLAKFMPSISIFLQKIEQSAKDDELIEFSEFDFSKEIKKIETTLSKDRPSKEKFSIIKDLIKYIST
ncbi:MAG: hypothetical protein ACTSVV_07740 [Promethearchaeota archaeon]